MDQKLQAASGGREYVDLEPDTQWVDEEDCGTLLVQLPGFKKEHLRLQLTIARTLKISGERPLGGTKWLRVRQEYPISTNSDTDKITAKLEDGIMYIRQPKITVSPPEIKQEKEKPTTEAPKPPSDQPQPQTTDQKTDDDRQETKSTDGDQSKEKDQVGKTNEPRDGGNVGRGDLERVKSQEGGKGNGGVEDGKGKIGETSEGKENCGGGGGGVVVGKKKPMGMVVNLVVGILLAIVLGIYFRNWIQSGN